MTVIVTEKMAPMNRAERGKRLKTWADQERGRTALLAQHSGLARGTVEAAYKGTARESNYGKLEAARKYIEEHPEDVAAGADFVSRNEDDEIIEFEVSADAVGLRVFVRGPITRGDDLSAQVAKVFREIQKQVPGSSDVSNQD